MDVTQTSLPGVVMVTPRRHGDDRGFFAETWNAPRFAEAGIAIDWMQDNHSVSAAAGTLRGLHFQTPPHAQDKLVRCGRGALLDVAVDARRGSSGFGRWTAAELSAENGRQLLVPKGFLHGFVTLEPDTEIVYKCSDVYAPDCDGAVAWDDPAIGIDWRLGGREPVLSAKDAAAGTLSEVAPPFDYDGPLPWEAEA